MLKSSDGFRLNRLALKSRAWGLEVRFESGLSLGPSPSKNVDNLDDHEPSIFTQYINPKTQNFLALLR